MRLPHFPLFLLFSLCACSAPAGQDLVLHYDRPAESLEEALPIGNGRLGALLYGGVGDERISLNDITLWTGEPDRGAAHPDLLNGVGAYATETIPLIREALDREDYRTAERLQRQVQGHFSEAYQPLGTLWIRHTGEGEITGYRRELDLAAAVARASYKRDGKAYEAEYFASAPDSVIVVRLRAEDGLHARLRLESPLQHTTVARDG